MFSTFIRAEEEQREIRIRVVVLDSLKSEPIEFATASVTKTGADSPFKYALTDSKGIAEIRGIIPGSYTLKIEYLGYETYLKNITLAENRVIELGSVKLKEQMNTLNSVVVSAVGNPIIVKKDTIEYNASSFKTTDSDMLEELLKKLP
ncbi:MAG: carboxypeptidase-like regulatory domain-containing protein, partial [Bacteroidales bacterium]|nr:carboxypeptidase-like regulatory domain-containing protein [Bacteroidales bacterium]